MRVQFRSFVLNPQHFIDQAFKFATAFLYDFKFLIKLSGEIMHVPEMFSDHRMFMFLYALMHGDGGKCTQYNLYRTNHM